MKIKRILSLVLGMSVLALSVGVYNNIEEENPIEEGNSIRQMDMSEEDAIFPSGNFEVVGENGEVINVIIPEEYDGRVSVGEIKEIIAENKMKSGERLTIHDVGKADIVSNGDIVENYNGNQISNDVMPQWRWYDLWLTINTSWYYGGEFVAKDVFVASAARGETYTLTKKFSSSLSYECETGMTYSDVKATIGAKSSVSYQVEKSHKYSGPDRSSKYNTTEYRVKFYAKRCYVTQKVTGWPSDHTDTYKARFLCPQRYLSYSIDRLV